MKMHSAVRAQQSPRAKAFIVGAVLTLAMAALPVSVAQAQMSPESERAAHPRLVAALQNLREALAYLEQAPNDFGGHKVEAINDTRRAIHSIKRALYYRLKMDDNAIDQMD